MGYGVADYGILDALDACGDVANLSGRQAGGRDQSGRTHAADLHNVEFCAGCHHADVVAGADSALHHADIYDNALVAVVVGVKNQRLKRSVRVAGRSRDVGHDALEHLLDIQSGLG